MGLETTSAFMKIEETFGITIPDESVTIRTVGDIFYIVMRQLDTGDKFRCFTPYAFMKLRKPLQALTGRSKSEIRPDTPLAEIFPWWSRRRLWKALTTQSGLRLPDLETVIPGCLLMLVTVLGGLSLGIFAMSVVMTHIDKDQLAAWIVLPIGVLIVLCAPIGLAMGAQALLQVRFPGRAVTVMDLINVTRKECYGYLTGAGNLVSSGDVWLKIRSIVAEASGVAPDALLVENLNMG